MHSAGGFGVETQFKLFVPIELEAGLAQLIVTVAGVLSATGNVAGMGRDLVRNHPLANIVLVGQTEVFLRRHVAEHRGSGFGGNRGTDGRGDVVVAWCDVGDQWAEDVERCFMAEIALLLDVHFDEVHRDVAGAFDHDLTAMLPRFQRQFAESFQFGKLGCVVGIGQAAGTQAIAEAEGDVIRFHDFAQFIEVRVPSVLLMVRDHPRGHERTAATDDAGDAIPSQRNVFEQSTPAWIVM